MSDQKLLLITADDFGMCHAVNAGIVRALTEGVVTSSTLMAPCPWFIQAVALAKQHHLKCGVHLTLTCDWDLYRWGPISHAPSLVAADGAFHQSFTDLAASAAKDNEILREFDAQIEHVRASGIEPTHLDVHMLNGEDKRPEMERFKELLRKVCRKHGMPWFREYRAGTGLLYLDGQACVSGVSERETWDAIIRWTEPGLYHLIGHPAESAAELDALCSENHPARKWTSPIRGADLRYFTNPATRTWLEHSGFTLVDAATMVAALPKQPRKPKPRSSTVEYAWKLSK